MNTFHSKYILWVLLVFLLSGCVANQFTDTMQPEATVAFPMEQPLGQTFVAQHAGLNGIELSLSPLTAASSNLPILHLRADPAAQEDLALVQSPEPVTAAGVVRFAFAPQADSHGRRYYFFVEGADLLLGASEQSTYPDGTSYRNHLPQTGDIAFGAVYASSAIFLDLFSFSLHFLQILGIALFLFVLPGLALAKWLLSGYTLHWGERLGLAAGASIAIYPILFLWSHTLGLVIGEWLAWIPGIVGGLYLLWSERAQISAFPQKLWAAANVKHMPDWVLVGLLLLLTAVRILPVRTLPAPLWGDSVHHTLIVQLLVENGGLFDSWEPYAPIQSLTYHFGFHTAAAVWEWVTRWGAPTSVLLTGQMLNVLAVLALVPVAYRISGRRPWAAVGAVLVAGYLSQMPGYYVNWGRYTQLASQIIFPLLLWAFHLWWTEKRKPKDRLFWLMAVLTAGLILTHYRVATVAVAAGLAWTIWGIWVQRKDPKEWLPRLWGLVGIALLSAISILPWAMLVQSGQLVGTFTAVVTRDVQTNTALSQELEAWLHIGEYYPRSIWIGALVVWLLAFWKRRELAIPLAIFTPLAFLMTNPYLLGLPGTGWITNFLLVIGAYIPIAWLWGWFFAGCVDRLERIPIAAVLVLPAVIGITLFGARTQLHTVDTAHQMVTQSDVAAFSWIRNNTPPDSRFLVNGFLAYNNSMAVGSDAGWWLPFYTQRANNIPPMPYATERLSAGTDKVTIRQFMLDVYASQGEPTQLHPILCGAGITHVYLGQRQGQVGYGAQPLVPSSWLQKNSAFVLIHQEDQAQIWEFERSRTCPNP